jgi:phosphopantothenoylcysteine decarboxylase/phosphopantothenate--cysteine ligase
MDIQKKHILLGITGGIAAYKAADLASKLTRMGGVVRTIMTKHAGEFISPLTIRSITGQPVVTTMFDPTSKIEHISLADWADIVVIAPATANIVGKVRAGIADDLLSTTIMATTAPVLFVPAMNVHMYENPIVQQNISALQELGYLFMEPESGFLACGYEGKGRFPDPAEIIYHIRTYLYYKRDLKGKKIMVTAGSCQEALDPVRMLTNRSSGKMGLALARALSIRGAQVCLVYASISENVPYYLGSIQALSAREMYDEISDRIADYDALFMAAAVTDYTPKLYSEEKIKKNDTELDLRLVKTKDILSSISKQKTRQLLIGFALETGDEIAKAKAKLEQKKLDFIVANSADVIDSDSTSVTVLGEKTHVTISGDKFSVANKILDAVFL